MANELTTMQIDVETRDMLKALAEAYERTAAGHLRWLVKRDYEKLAEVKLIARLEERAVEKAEAKTKKKK